MTWQFVLGELVFFTMVLLAVNIRKKRRFMKDEQEFWDLIQAASFKSFDTPELTQEYINEATRPLAEKLEQDKE